MKPQFNNNELDSAYQLLIYCDNLFKILSVNIKDAVLEVLLRFIRKTYCNIDNINGWIWLGKIGVHREYWEERCKFIYTYALKTDFKSCDCLDSLIENIERVFKQIYYDN